MDRHFRLTVGTWGGVAAGLAMFGLGAFFFVVHQAVCGSDTDDRFHEFVWKTINPRNPVPLTLVLLAMVWMTFGQLLCVKAVCNPPRFWRHTGWHLAIASGLTWLLTLALFFAFALLPE